MPLAALVWLFVSWPSRPWELDFALLAGAIGLLLALGPQLRLFDRVTDVVLPYSWLERLVPALAYAGCVNRFEQLAFLPLGLATAWAAHRLWSRPRGPLAVAVAAVVLMLEYLPVRPSVATGPQEPADPAL